FVPGEATEQLLVRPGRGAPQRLEHAPHRPFAIAAPGAFEHVACLGSALFDHAVEPATAAGGEGRLHHALAGEAVLDLPAGLARLARFEQGRAEPETVAQQHVVLGQAGDREIAAEGAWLAQQLVIADLLAPCRVMIEGIMMHGHVRAAVMHRVGLRIAVEAEIADRDPSFELLLGNRALFFAAEGHAPAAQQRSDAPAHAAAPDASRSSSARLFLCAAVLSWPQAASISRPRGVRTGALIPASNTILEKRRIR